MKILCLKTDEQSKYLTTHLLDGSWLVDITESGTCIKNNQTNEAVFILDLTASNANLIDVGTSAPVDWSPRVYFYNTEFQSWEKKEIEAAVELSQEKIQQIEEEIKQAELALSILQAE